MTEPRPAGGLDIPELVRLRAVMLASLGVDPGPQDAGWRSVAADWFAQRLARPHEWTFRVIGPVDGRLRACGAAWLIEHLPGPSMPSGQRGYVGFMVTDPAERRRGHARRILADLVEWLAGRDVVRLELHAAADGRALYRAAGFVDDGYPAMYRMLDKP